MFKNVGDSGANKVRLSHPKFLDATSKSLNRINLFNLKSKKLKPPLPRIFSYLHHWLEVIIL